jgi:nucleoside-diphosphate-sugar epimerase
MALLVTGASGHIGLELAKRAASCGMDVVATHRGDLHEAQAKAAGPGVRWQGCDLADASAVRDLAGKYGIDTCIHCAAISNEAYARPNPLDAINTNVGATANLLDAAKQGAWRRFVLVSSGSVFQLRRDTVGEITEDQAPEPANVYSTTKVCAEQLTRMYRSEYGLSASTVRISWVFGPPVISDQPQRGPIPSYLLRVLRGIPIREGGADFVASFTYIADVVEALLGAASAPELRHGIYHFGHGVNFSAGQAADAVRKAVPGAVIELGSGTEPWTKYTALRGPLAGDRFRLDTGYAPSHSLDAGVAAYADWMRANPGAWRV